MADENASLPSTARFGDRVDDYVRYRPDYPAALLDWLQREQGVDSSWRVADIGAGTGISSKLFLDAGYRVTAVEPNAPMRAAAERWLKAYAGFDAVDGGADATGLPDASVDLVTVAQAFHWFDAAAAAREIHRVLRPEGRLAIVWNRRDLSDPAHAGLEEIVERYRGETPSHRSSGWRSEVEATGLFRVAAETEIEFTHEVSRAGLVARVASISFMAALPDPEKRRALADAQAMADRLDEPIPLPHTCELFCLEPV
jgi:SAM-dependent methyltransferase